MKIENRAILKNEPQRREISREVAKSAKVEEKKTIPAPSRPSPLRGLFVFLLMACAAHAAGPATIIGFFQSPDGTALSTNISFTPVREQPIASGTNLFNLQAKVIQTTNSIGIVQLHLGRYRVQIGNNFRDAFLIDVPEGTNTYQINELLSTSLEYVFAVTNVNTYQLLSEKGLANGYASLDGNALVPLGQLGSGSPTSSKFLRGDGTWAVPAGGGGGSVINVSSNNVEIISGIEELEFTNGPGNITFFVVGAGTTAKVYAAIDASVTNGLHAAILALATRAANLEGQSNQWLLATLYNNGWGALATNALSDKQPLDADLTDLADGELTGSKVGTGINGDNITSGTVADARIASTLTRDTEWDSQAEVEVAWGGANIIIATEIDSMSEIEALVGSLNILIETEIDGSAELRLLMDDETGGGVLVFNDTPTLLTPTIASFANATHSHQNAAGGGTLDAAAIAAGTVATARLGSGTANSGTFLRGDQTWATPGGGGTVTTLKENGSQVGDADISILDFLGADFDLTESPDTEVNIVVAAALTRDTEWDTIAEIESATSVNIIVATEIDTIAELEALLAGVNVLLETELDASAELRALMDDESGTGALLFAGGDIGAATATTPSAGDNDTSVATTAFVAVNFVDLAGAQQITGAKGIGTLFVNTNLNAAAITATNSISILGSGSPELELGGGATNYVYRLGDNGVTVTQSVGVVEFASAVVLTADARRGNDFQLTNHIAHAVDLLITNYARGNYGSVKLTGAVSGGTDRNITIRAKPGDFVHWFGPTNGATSLTVSNGQSVAMEYWITRHSGSNVVNIAYGRGQTSP